MDALRKVLSTLSKVRTRPSAGADTESNPFLFFDNGHQKQSEQAENKLAAAQTKTKQSEVAKAPFTGDKKAEEPKSDPAVIPAASADVAIAAEEKKAEEPKTTDAAAPAEEKKAEEPATAAAAAPAMKKKAAEPAPAAAAALLELGVSGDAHAVFADMDVNSDGIVDEEFRAVVGMTSSVESWAKRLPWWQAVADAMPKPNASRDDPLRVVAGLSDEQIDAVCRVVAEETATELRRQIKHLEWSFLQMDLAEQERVAGGAGAKFQTFKANAGTIENFYAGLGGRIG